MRLIDADALKANFNSIPISSSCYATVAEARAALNLAVTVDAMIYQAPTIPAVPLEPLCEWMAGYKVPPPEYALEAVGAYDPIDPNSVVHTPNQVRDAWKYAIQNMMECGLLKEDEDG